MAVFHARDIAVRGSPPDLVMQNFQSITAFVAHIVLDRCQIYTRKGRGKNIVKTAHAVVAGYGKAALAHSINNTVGHHVVYRHKGGNFFVIQALARQFAAHKVLYLHIFQFGFRADIAAFDLHAALGAQLAKGIAQPLQTLGADGVCLVQRG